MKLFLIIAGAVLIGFINAYANNTHTSPANAAPTERVVLLHGLGRSKRAMWRMAEHLESAGYEVHRLNYRSINNTTENAIKNIALQIDACCEGSNIKLHFVGHSYGGILIRAYLRDHKLANLGNTVMVGTPNKGSKIAQRLNQNSFINFLVPIARELGTDQNSYTNQLPPPYYPVGVIAGIKDGEDNEDYLPGADDGLVQVNATKLQGMSDYIEIAQSHSRLRSSELVANQVISFLKQGKFTH